MSHSEIKNYFLNKILIIHKRTEKKNILFLNKCLFLRNVRCIEVEIKTAFKHSKKRGFLQPAVLNPFKVSSLVLVLEE